MKALQKSTRLLTGYKTNTQLICLIYSNIIVIDLLKLSSERGVNGEFFPPYNIHLYVMRLRKVNYFPPARVYSKSPCVRGLVNIFGKLVVSVRRYNLHTSTSSYFGMAEKCSLEPFRNGSHFKKPTQHTLNG